VPAGRSGVGQDAGRRCSRSRRRHAAPRPGCRLIGLRQGRESTLSCSASIAPNTKLVTDDWPSYHDIPEITHQGDHESGPMAAHIVLPWPIAVLKSQALGPGRLPRTAQGQPPALPRQFVFRFNRRRTRHAAFATLLPSAPTPPQLRTHADAARLPSQSRTEWPPHVSYLTPAEALRGRYWRPYWEWTKIALPLFPSSL